MRQIMLNLPESYIRGLERLVNDKFYPNRAEAIRVAIRDFLNKELGLGWIHQFIDIDPGVLRRLAMDFAKIEESRR